MSSPDFLPSSPEMMGLHARNFSPLQFRPFFIDFMYFRLSRSIYTIPPASPQVLSRWLRHLTHRHFPSLFHALIYLPPVYPGNGRAAVRLCCNSVISQRINISCESTRSSSGKIATAVSVYNTVGLYTLTRILQKGFAVVSLCTLFTTVLSWF